MIFDKKADFYRPIETLLTDSSVQTYVDLLTNFSHASKTIYKKPKIDSLYETFLFGYLEYLIIFKDINAINQIIKLIDIDTTSTYEWHHWNNNKESIKKLIIKIRDKMDEKINNFEILSFFYNLNIEKESNLQFNLNILMRYLIMTYVIVNKDEYFASFQNSEDGLKKFLENTKIYSLQQGFSDIAGAFLSHVLQFNFKLYFWEENNFESEKKQILKKKYFIAKENWQNKPTIALIQNKKNNLCYRILYYKENEIAPLKKINDDLITNFNCLTHEINDFWNNYIEKTIKNIKNEIEIIYGEGFIQKKQIDNDIDKKFDLISSLSNKIDKIYQITNVSVEKIIKIDFFDNFKKIDLFIEQIKNDLKILIFENLEKENKKKMQTYVDQKQLYENEKKQNSLDFGNKFNLAQNYIIKNVPINEKLYVRLLKQQKSHEEIPKIQVIPEKNDNLKEKLNNLGDKINKNDQNEIYPIEEKQKLINKPENLAIQEINPENFDIYQKKTLLKIDCPICGSRLSVDQNIITLDCEHRICKECLKGWLTAKFELGQWDFENFKCFVPGCNHLININILKHIVGEDKFSKMCDILAEKMCIICPYQDCKSLFVNEGQNLPKIKCPICNKAICGKCNEKFHEAKACPKLFDAALKALKNEKLNVCPECFEVYLKDDKCAHVKCLKCGTEFCFECSCHREPTLCHGNHYHRPDCKFYFAKEDVKTKKIINTDEYEPNKCKLCEKNGKACKRPISYKEFYNKFISKK